VLFALVRSIEIKMGKKTFIGNLTSKTDAFFVALVKGAQELFNKTSAGIHRLFTHHVPARSERMWNGVRRFAEAKQVKARDALRGRKILKEGGNVSFFLKNISEARRKNSEGGTILG